MGRTLAHRARVAHPVVTGPLEDGCVVERDTRIVAVGRWADLRDALPADAEIHDHGDVWLVPGLVNAHAHLELTGHGTVPFGGSLFNWLDKVAEQSKLLARERPEAFAEAADEGARMLRETGTAAILDTTLWGVRARSDALIVPAYEFLSFSAREDERPFYRQAIERAAADAARGLRCALEPHTLYTVHPGLMRKAREIANREGVLFATHVAETREEVEFISRGTGPMVDWLRDQGAPIEEYGTARSPVRRLDELGVLDRAVLFHANYVEERDFATLVRRSASVVYCPRSHRHFGHEPHPAPAMVRAGVNVCLGTDGLVSNVGLDMRAEMLCALHRCPGLDPETVLLMATLCGARALGIDGELGALAPGLRAEFAELPVAEFPLPLPPGGVRSQG